MTMNITDFCDNNKIDWFPICLKITPLDKVVHGETKYEKDMETIKHLAYNHSIPKCTDFANLPIETIRKRQELYKNEHLRKIYGLNYIAIDTRKVFQVDYDTPNYPTRYQSLYNFSPYFQSATKSYGKHVFITTDYKPKTQRDCLFGEGEGDIELLSNGWAFATANAIVENATDGISYLTEIEMKEYITEKPTPVKTYTQPTPTPTTRSNMEKYLELMGLIGNKIKRNLWLKLTGWAVNHISKEEYLSFIDAVYISEATKMWDDLEMRKRDISIYAIENIAKEVCPDKYKEWVKKYKKMITLDILNKGERDVCDFIAPLLKHSLVFCMNNWYSVNPTTGLWNTGINPTNNIIKIIQDEISTRLAWLHDRITEESGEQRAKTEKEIEGLNTHYRKVSGGAFSSQCKKCLEYTLLDNQFYKKLNVIPYQIPFINGVWDIKTNEFIPKIDASDFITTTIQRPYTGSDETTREELRKELFKICNCNQTQLDYYLSILGYSFCGVASKEQYFWSMYGATASNGKSTVFDALRDICPELVSRTGSEFYEDNEKTRHKTLATFTPLTRLIYSNELTKRKQDREFIKQIGDGTTITFGKMYGEKVDLSVNFKAFIISNNLLNFDNDNGIERRLRTCEFKSTFSETATEDNPTTRVFKRDTDFPTKLKTEYANALLDLIFESAHTYYKDQKLKPYPDEWKTENEQVIATNNTFADIFKEFEYAPDYYIHKDEVATVLHQYGITYSQREFMGELKRFPQYKVSYSAQERKRINGKRVKGFWVGMRLKQDNEEEETVMEEDNEEETVIEEEH